MTISTSLEVFAQHVATTISNTDTEVSHDRYGKGIGGFKEPEQVEFFVERLRSKETEFDEIQTEVRYPNCSQRCDIVLKTSAKTIPVEVKLLRFNRANGDLEPTAYDSIFSPFSGSLIADAQKLADSDFEFPAGLLGLYYERGDESAPVFDPKTLAEKVAIDIDYWFDLSVEVCSVVNVPKLRHPVHRRGAVIAWSVKR